tara:strand:+ start:441 stop:764 length:324 start_codon:yes stop_codon:yes gene_type:complete
MSTEKKRKEGTGHGVDLQDRQKVEPPKKFKVILHNDDYTPMEFVVLVLMDVFNYGVHRAHEVMLQVHEQGKGIAGVFPKEIAWMKTKKCNKYAQQHGHPLMVTMEAE